MSALFKKTKKQAETQAANRKPADAPVAPVAEVSATAPVAPKALASGTLTLQVRRPWITEKATRMSHFNQYVFLVDRRCNKTEAAKAIRSIYGVTVTNVRSITVPGKRRRLGSTLGRIPDYKKIIVTLKEGESIDVLPHA